MYSLRSLVLISVCVFSTVGFAQQETVSSEQLSHEQSPHEQPSHDSHAAPASTEPELELESEMSAEHTSAMSSANGSHQMHSESAAQDDSSHEMPSKEEPQEEMSHEEMSQAKTVEPSPFARDQAYENSQAAIGRELSDYRFYNTQGQSRSLADYRGKPLVISLIYTSCFHICPTTTKHLMDVVEKARKVLGDESFNVVTIGFDTVNDTADTMRSYARQQGVDIDEWDFLATNAQVITDLAKELGFLYYPTPAGFDHLVQNSIIDAQGVVYRQVYGINFEVPHFVEPLKELVYGEEPNHSFFQGVSNKVRLFCTVYDPASDSYQFDYSIFIGLVMGLVMATIFVRILVREWRYSNRMAKEKSH